MESTIARRLMCRVGGANCGCGIERKRQSAAGAPASELGVSHTTVLHWHHAGRFPNATREGRSILIPSSDIHGPRELARKPVRPASEDPTLRRPYRALVSAIILQALNDLHHPDLEAEAQAWLDSPMCHLMLETLGMDPEELPAAIDRGRERKPRLLGGAQGPGPGSADTAQHTAQNEFWAWCG